MITPVHNNRTIDSSADPVDHIEKTCITSETQVCLMSLIYAEVTTESLHPQTLSWTLTTGLLTPLQILLIILRKHVSPLKPKFVL